MNNDLIIRQQLLEYLAEEEKMIQDDAERFGINKDVVEGMKQNIHAVTDYVEEADVAYDVENVIEQLKEQSMQSEKDMQLSDSCSEASYYAGMWQAYEKAIKIAKAGLIAYDSVCEWKQEDDNLITGCGDYFNMFDNCTEKFNFCPHCGKKIKEME